MKVRAKDAEEKGGGRDKSKRCTNSSMVALLARSKVRLNENDDSLKIM